MRKLTTEEFICRARRIHGYKYDYSKTKYYRFKHKLLINCPRHGLFVQTAFTHLRGSGCKRCSRRLNKNQKLWLEFIKIINQSNIKEWADV